MIEKAICLWFLFLYGFFLFIFYWFFIFYFVCFGKILSQLEAASSVLPRIETFARCPRVVPSAAPRALRSGNALRFLCSVEPRTQLLILTKNLLGGFYRLHWRACAEAIAVHVKDFEIFCCPHFEKKSDTEIKS